jgi:hypothetical protein
LGQVEGQRAEEVAAAIMQRPVLTQAQFLVLSARLCDDFRQWISESLNYHTLTKEQVRILNEAAEIIDQATIKLTEVKPE